MLVSSIEIAEMSGVTKAAVSNWKHRYPDFPKPQIVNRQTKLYDNDEMEHWLLSKGKRIDGSRA